jgi:hypothetical protein
MTDARHNRPEDGFPVLSLRLFLYLPQLAVMMNESVLARATLAN